MFPYIGRYALGVASVMVVALALGSPLGAAPAGKQSIKIDSRTRGIMGGSGNFILTLGQGGDLGTVSFTRSFGPEKTAADGQQYGIGTEKDTLTGRNGTLVIRAVGPIYTMGFGDSEVWEGKWSIVSGTGDYSGMRGAGRFFGTANQTTTLIKRSTGFVQS
jgi:hypothetical protein